MAASNTDLFRKAARKWVGQIGAGGVADAAVTTIPLASATGLPTDTAIDVVIGRVDSAGTKTASLEETITGVVSGSNLVTCTRGVEGTAQAHLAGAVVEVVLTNSMWGDLTDGILVEHNQTGKHKIAKIVGIQVIYSETATATGDGKAFFRVPAELTGMNLTGVAATVYTAGTTGTTDIQIRNKTDTADMLSTKLTIDSGETDSSTAATPAVINTATDDIVTGDVLAIDVDAISTTAAQGLYIELRFELP